MDVTYQKDVCFFVGGVADYEIADAFLDGTTTEGKSWYYLEDDSIKKRIVRFCLRDEAVSENPVNY